MKYRLIWVVGIVAAAQTGPQANALEQPIPFSHKQHVSLPLKCNDCHPNPDPGEAMVLPSATKCMLCHVTVSKNKPDIQTLGQYATSKREIPWVRLYQVPDWVFWNHRTHLEAKLNCETCHGNIASMNITARTTNAVTMGGCVACHAKSKAPTGCQTCHENRGS